MISSVVMQPHLHLRAGYQSYRDRINNFMSGEGKGPAVREGPAERHSMSLLRNAQLSTEMYRTARKPRHRTNVPNRPDVLNITRKYMEPPGSLTIVPEPRQNRTGTTPAPHRKSSPDLDDVRIFS